MHAYLRTASNMGGMVLLTYLALTGLGAVPAVGAETFVACGCMLGYMYKLTCEGEGNPIGAEACTGDFPNDMPAVYQRTLWMSGSHQCDCDKGPQLNEFIDCSAEYFGAKIYDNGNNTAAANTILNVVETWFMPSDDGSCSAPSQPIDQKKTMIVALVALAATIVAWGLGSLIVYNVRQCQARRAADAIAAGRAGAIATSTATVPLLDPNS